MQSSKELFCKNLKVWPSGLDLKFFYGFSDADLELLCTLGLSGFDSTLPFKKKTWLYWPTEIYGFGRCYREWLKWPNWLPIPVYGDHGVCIHGKLEGHEINSRPKTHLTWYRDRAEYSENHKFKKMMRIPHPWVTYRRNFGYKLNPDARGTLIFFAHSIVGTEIVDYDWDGYFEKLVSLPDDFHPLVICMHQHDINKGYHRALRKFQLPIVTVGEASSPYFVDRFYSLVSSFKYATSSIGGSDLFYCEEMGVRYFLMGGEPVYVNFSHTQAPLGIMKPLDEVCERASQLKRKLFSEFPPTNSVEKKKFVSDVLGLDVDANRIKLQLRRVFILESIRQLPQVLYVMLLGFGMPALSSKGKVVIKRLFRRGKMS